MTENENRKFVFNTTIVPPATDLTAKFTRISIKEAKEFVRDGDFLSSVGHEGTAKVLSRLLETEIKMNRRNDNVKPSDEILAFKLKTRIEEGKVLSEEELNNLPFELWHIEITK